MLTNALIDWVDFTTKKKKSQEILKKDCNKSYFIEAMQHLLLYIITVQQVQKI